jgi:hypothetical protein
MFCRKALVWNWLSHPNLISFLPGGQRNTVRPRPDIRVDGTRDHPSIYQEQSRNKSAAASMYLVDFNNNLGQLF